MKRTTVLGTWVLILLAAAGLWYGVYWFYRVPPEAKPVDGYAFVGSGPVDGGIPSINSPTFESVVAADQYLNDDGYGLDVEVDAEHRFYPYQILVWHEIVNDQFGDVPVVVTYSPLTDTGMAFERTVDGEAVTFSVSGLLWNNNSVMLDDKTESKWVQIYGKPVDGDATALRPVLARTMTWSDWKAAYPRGDVLTRDTGVSRDYTRNPYGNYASTPAVWFPLTRVDARLDAKTSVYVVSVGSERAAYPADVIGRVGNVRETVAGVPIEVTYNEELGTVIAHRLELDGDAGEELIVTRGFWFAFSAAYPGIHLYELP